MKAAKGVIFSLLMLALVLTCAQQAEAARGSQVGASGEPVIEVFPNAPGTKYSGPLTVYYIPDPDPDKTDNYFMHFFMRLKKGSNLYSFSGVSEESYHYRNETIDQQMAINYFIQNTVIPILYPEPEGLPEALVKSVDLVVEDDFDHPNCCKYPDETTMLFIIMDVVIAVQD